MGPKKNSGTDCECEGGPRGVGGAYRGELPTRVGGEQSASVVGSADRPARTRGIYRAGKGVERAIVAASWSSALLTPGDWLVFPTTDAWLRQGPEGQSTSIAANELASGSTVPTCPASASFTLNVSGSSDTEVAFRAVSSDGRIRFTRYSSVDQ